MNTTLKDGRSVAQEEIGSTAGNPPQRKPGDQDEMSPEPQVVPEAFRPAGKLEGRRALITGGDSGIGRSVAVMFAMEGADVAIVYDKSDDDAAETARLVRAQRRRCLL